MSLQPFVSLRVVQAAIEGLPRGGIVKFSVTKHGRRVRPSTKQRRREAPAGGPVARKRGLNSEWRLKYALRTITCIYYYRASSFLLDFITDFCRAKL